MSQVSRAAELKVVVGNVLAAAAIVIAVINNGTYKWAIGLPIVLAVVGVGLRIEAALTSRWSSDSARPGVDRAV